MRRTGVGIDAPAPTAYHRGRSDAPAPRMRSFSHVMSATDSSPRTARVPANATIPVVLLAIIVFPIGCATVHPPKPIAAPIAIPAAFGETGTASTPDRWWTTLGDDVLDGLVAKALGGNLTLRAAWARFEAAEASARIAGAALMPTVDAEVGAGRSVSRMPVKKNGRDTLERRYATDLSAGLFAAWEIDLWGGVRAERAAAQLDAEASKAALGAAAVSLSAEVAIAWYRLVEQAGQLALLDEQIQTNETVAELLTVRFRQGQSAAAAVLRQRQLAEARRGDRAAAESVASATEHRLAILVGRPPTETVATRRTTLPTLPPLPRTGLPVALVERRPDVREAYLRLLAADRRVASAVADRFPRLVIGGRATVSGEKVRDLVHNWLLGTAADAVAPLIDGGRRRAEVERLEAVVSERLSEYGQTILLAIGEVEDALVREREQRRFLVSLDRQIELATGAAERIGDQYRAGAIEYLNVLDALLSLQNLQRARLAAARQLVENRVALYRALAGGWAFRRADHAPADEPAQDPTP